MCNSAFSGIIFTIFSMGKSLISNSFGKFFFFQMQGFSNDNPCVVPRACAVEDSRLFKTTDTGDMHWLFDRHLAS